MPPSKPDDSKPVDLVQIYGSKGPAAGKSQFVEHEIKREPFDLTGMIVESGMVPGRKEAKLIMGSVVLVLVAVAGFFYWMHVSDNPPPDLYRAAIDAAARAR